MEEPHDLEEDNVAEQPAPSRSKQSKPPLINQRTGKPRKTLDETALARLAKAREKANAIRSANSLKKLEQKVKNMKIKQNTYEVEEPEAEPEEEPAEEVKTPEEPAEEEEPKIIKKKVGKKKPVIIVEQSSDDEDEFEANEKVLFVKRVSRKKKEKEPEKEPEPPQEHIPPPPIVKQKPSLIEQQYNAMFNGQFLNNQRRRF